MDIKIILTSLLFENPVTPIQKETNDIVKVLITKPEIVQEYCKKEFLALTEILQNVSSGEAVKSEKLAEAYTKFHEYQVSDLHELNCMLLFEDTCDPSYREAQGHISYSISVAIRKFLLTQKVDLLPSPKTVTTPRQMTSGCKARVRYVGGYCISKIRYRYLQKQMTSSYKTSVHDQEQYEESATIVKMLDALKVNESVIQRTSEIPETLIDVSRRQNFLRGLTHVSDDLYYFFIQLCEACLKCLIDKNMHIHGSHIHDHCLDYIIRSKDIHETFVGIISHVCSDKDWISSEDGVVSAVLYEVTLKASSINIIYNEVVRKFVMVMLNQYRKDLLQALSVEKTLAHRKQIQTRKAKKKLNTGESSVISMKSSDPPIPCSSKEISAPVSISVPSVSECKDDEVCKVCQKVGKSVFWVQCDKCLKWLHRNCAKLRSKAKWEAATHGNVKFYCSDCKE